MKLTQIFGIESIDPVASIYDQSFNQNVGAR